MTSSAVLFSGGLDSAVLLASELHDGREVWPIHVWSGFAWEQEEATAIEHLLADEAFAGRVHGAQTLSVDMRDIYPSTHWALAGQPPAYDTPDEDVFLEGRNIALLSKAGILCARLGIGRIAMGPLAGNPFPDASPEFFSSMANTLTRGLGRAIEIAAPFAQLHKEDVIALGVSLGVPLAKTLSCMNPQAGRHCGACSKCRERLEAFRLAGIPDAAVYLSRRE
jgi:7-cyano-7-deazaguanine synthase